MALKDREAQRTHLRAQLDAQAALATLGDTDTAELRRNLQARLMDWTGLLGRHPQQARSILAKLLVGRLVFTPRLDPVAGDAYHFAGEGRLDPLLDGVIALPGQHNALVTPDGRVLPEIPFTIILKGRLAA